MLSLICIPNSHDLASHIQEADQHTPLIPIRHAKMLTLHPTNWIGQELCGAMDNTKQIVSSLATGANTSL